MKEQDEAPGAERRGALEEKTEVWGNGAQRRRPPEMLCKSRGKGTGRFISVFLRIICLLVAVFFLFDIWIMANCFLVEVVGSSMEDTLQSGDYVYVVKNTQASRGDIVIINVTAYREEQHISGNFIVKRLIATEGDKVRCIDGAVSVCYAGEETYTVLSESYVKGATSDFGEVEVGEGEIFFLGDNRTVSKDSRAMGCFLYSDIEGVVPQWSLSAKSFIYGWVRAQNYFSSIFK